MEKTATYTVLESIITVSGELRVILNSFDAQIPIGSTFSDANGNEWKITEVERKIGSQSNNALQKKVNEFGATLYHIKSNSQTRPNIGDVLFVL